MDETLSIHSIELIIDENYNKVFRSDSITMADLIVVIIVLRFSIALSSLLTAKDHPHKENLKPNILLKFCLNVERKR